MSQAPTSSPSMVLKLKVDATKLQSPAPSPIQPPKTRIETFPASPPNPTSAPAPIAASSSTGSRKIKLTLGARPTAAKTSAENQRKMRQNLEKPAVAPGRLGDISQYDTIDLSNGPGKPVTITKGLKVDRAVDAGSAVPARKKVKLTVSPRGAAVAAKAEENGIEKATPVASSKAEKLPKASKRPAPKKTSTSEKKASKPKDPAQGTILPPGRKVIKPKSKAKAAEAAVNKAAKQDGSRAFRLKEGTLVPKPDKDLDLPAAPTAEGTTGARGLKRPRCERNQPEEVLDAWEAETGRLRNGKRIRSLHTMAREFYVANESAAAERGEIVCGHAANDEGCRCFE
ncbi:hypothetical protein EDC01DRAFT_781431 [Geopyxis carbonaria]|nr:hypothetical protein EDC01DRAFT_781431 [Geopyxis carbonaria]